MTVGEVWLGISLGTVLSYIKKAGRPAKVLVKLTSYSLEWGFPFAVTWVAGHLFIHNNTPSKIPSQHLASS